MTIPLEIVGHDTFAPFVGRKFIASNNQASVELELRSVNLLGHKRPDASRDPFSVIFRGPSELRLAQGIYHFSCEGLGEVEFFITQIAGGSRESEFEAVFT